MSLRAIYPFVDGSDVTQSTVAEKAIEQRRFVASLATSKLSASFAECCNRPGQAVIKAYKVVGDIGQRAVS